MVRVSRWCALGVLFRFFFAVEMEHGSSFSLVCSRCSFPKARSQKYRKTRGILRPGSQKYRKTRGILRPGPQKHRKTRAILRPGSQKYRKARGILRPGSQKYRKTRGILRPGSQTYRKTRGILSCLLYTSPSPRDKRQSRMPSSA